MSGDGLSDDQTSLSSQPHLSEEFNGLTEWFGSLSEESMSDFYDALYSTLYKLMDGEEGIYEQARQAHLESETQTFRPDYRGLVNFRDAMHHVSRFFNAVTDQKPLDAVVHLYLMKDHLERAAYDGQKRNVELLIRKSDEELLPPLIYKLSGLKNKSPSVSEHEENMRKIKLHYKQGRTRHSPEPFEEAEKIAQEYYEQIPDPGDVFHRLLIRGGSIVGLIAGSIVITQFLL